jgi:hypothetical protein
MISSCLNDTVSLILFGKPPSMSYWNQWALCWTYLGPAQMWGDLSLRRWTHQVPPHVIRPFIFESVEVTLNLTVFWHEYLRVEKQCLSLHLRCITGGSHPNEREGLLVTFCPCISHWKAENKTPKRMVYKSKRVVFYYDEGKVWSQYTCNQSAL